MNPIDSNTFVLLWFDPGGAATGWFMAGVDVRAFSRPEEKILRHLLFWDCGEIPGPRTAMLSRLIHRVGEVVQLARYSKRVVPPCPALHIGTEGFDLTQIKGSSENLLSPVEINAVLDWECHKRGVQLLYQKPNARLSITRERLKLYGFEGTFHKDEFSATQHGVVHLKNLKRQSISAPWKVQK